MPKKDLESVEEPVEVKPEALTPEPEVKPLEEPKAPPLSETQEFKDAVREAQSGWDRLNTSLRTEVTQMKSEAASAKADYEGAKADFQALQEQHDEAMGKLTADDPEAKRAYEDRKAIAEGRRENARSKAESEQIRYDAEMLIWAHRMEKKADALHAETGIPIADLEDCETEEAMEVKALRWEKAHPKSAKPSGEPSEPPEEPSPKVDSGLSTGTGGKLTVEQAETIPMDSYAEHPSVKARYK